MTDNDLELCWRKWLKKKIVIGISLSRIYPGDFQEEKILFPSRTKNV